MGALNRTCTCCRARVHVALIHDTKVKAPVCLTYYAKRAKERRTYRRTSRAGCRRSPLGL